MIVLWIILVLLILLLLTPVGIAAAFAERVLSLAVKIGPARVTILPQKPKTEEQKAKAEEKKARKKEKPKREKKASDAQKPKAKLTKDDILSIVKLALKALGRFQRSLRIDELLLHLTVATGDPYDTVLQYGYINAALGGVLPLLHNAFKVRKESVGVAMDFQQESMTVEAKLIMTLRLGQILYIALCAGGAFLLWLYRRKRRLKHENKIMQAEKGT